MGDLSYEEIGALTEQMLIDATNCYRPSWVKRIERASSYLDYRGIDAIAYVTYPDGREGPLLIQVKSHEKWREKYFNVDHPWAKEHKLLCLVISPWDTNVKICLNLYRELDQMRKVGIWHVATLAWRQRKGTAPIDPKKMQSIEATRGLRPPRPQSKKGAGFWPTIHLWWVCLAT